MHLAADLAQEGEAIQHGNARPGLTRKLNARDEHILLHLLSPQGNKSAHYRHTSKDEVLLTEFE